MSSAMNTPAKGVTVRMYRQGLGDCFLLTFPTVGGPFHMLIDCGVILGTPNPQSMMQKIVTDIRTTTQGHVHLLVATHEHWDHLSGFIQAGKEFNGIGTIDKLWLAWTEDPGNALGNKLRKERHETAAALHMAVERASDRAAMGAVDAIVQFFGVLGAGGSSTGAALEYLHQRVSSPRYCRPGEPPIMLPELPGVRFYVLGPPEDERKIKQSDPTARGKEVYDNSTALNAGTALKMALRRHLEPERELSEADEELLDLSFPFDSRYRIPNETAKQQRFFQEAYGFDTVLQGQGPEWRRIDDDWLGATGELALQLDSDTNNTSLALAIELIEEGKVLLFPGDAQVGNWLSWHDYSWEVEDGGQKRTVNAQDLLQRTVLYKVGHHGSHNATLRKLGLEMMTSPDLVAMVPIHEKTAHEIKHWNQMPFVPLMARLAEKTRGRVLRVDQGKPQQKPEDVSDAEWKAFEGHVREQSLYLEYVVS